MPRPLNRLQARTAGAAAEIIAGGQCDKSQGYFIAPTVILAHDPKFVTMVEEIFGPVLTVGWTTSLCMWC